MIKYFLGFVMSACCFSVIAKDKNTQLSPEVYSNDSQCRVELPIDMSSFEEHAQKVRYLEEQGDNLFSFPINIVTNLKVLDKASTVDITFDEACPMIFNYFMLQSLYMREFWEPMLQEIESFSKQISFEDLPNKSCMVSLRLPNLNELTSIDERLSIYLKQRLHSFKKATSEPSLVTQTIGVQVFFEQSCEKVLPEFLMQRLFPRDYLRLK